MAIRGYAHDATRRVEVASESLLQHSIMQASEPSSPGPLPSSLPPSSAPQPSQRTDGTPRRSRGLRDALSFGDEADGAGDQSQGTARRRRRPRTQQLEEAVPIVRDAVGESVSDAFETFLRT